MKPVVLLDVDGVIANFIDLYLCFCDLLLSRPVDKCHDDVTQWDTGVALGLTAEERSVVDRHMRAPGAAQAMAPYPGAVDAVRQLSERTDLWFVTAPYVTSPTWVFDRYTWLVRYFGERQADKTCNVTHKQRVHGDIFVDDKPSHLKAWQREWPEGTTVLWAQPYNSVVTPAENQCVTVRTNTWDVVLKMAGVE